MLHTRLVNVQKSAAVLQSATGIAPTLEDPALRQRLQAARQLRVRQQARGEKKWNVAMSGLAEQLDASVPDEEDAIELRFDYAQLCRSAGLWEQALRLR